MNLIEIKDKAQYNNFVVSQKHAQFLQSWEWGEFQKETGSAVKRFGVEDKNEFIFVFTLIKKSLGFGRGYFYCPRIEFGIKNEELKMIFDALKKIAKKDICIFLRFEPTYDLISSTYCLTKTIDVQPSKTLVLNLEKEKEEILKDMHQKTRYNIRLANKKGVKIKKVKAEEFEDFWKIMEQTKDRDDFRLHNKEHYKKMLEIGFMELYLAEYNNKIIAGNIISFFGDTATYVHGASSNKDRNVMAPYLLQWEIIKKAKDKGLRYYDFYGIDEQKWPGVTRFKRGFSGEVVEYPGTFDLVFNKLWYNVYKIVRKLRRLI